VFDIYQNKNLSVNGEAKLSNSILIKTYRVIFFLFSLDDLLTSLRKYAQELDAKEKNRGDRKRYIYSDKSSVFTHRH